MSTSTAKEPTANPQEKDKPQTAESKKQSLTLLKSITAASFQTFNLSSFMYQ